MLHVISLAQYATAYTRSWAADSTNGRIRMKAENDRAQQEILLLREEMRIKDAHMAVGSKNCDDPQVGMVAGLLPSCIAWISADLYRMTPP